MNQISNSAPQRLRVYIVLLSSMKATGLKKKTAPAKCGGSLVCSLLQIGSASGLASTRRECQQAAQSQQRHASGLGDRAEYESDNQVVVVAIETGGSPASVIHPIQVVLLVV